MLGVLGGMGPLATVDFLAKVVSCTPAQGDAGHIPLVVRSVPQIPDRNAAVLGRGPSPLDMLCAEARALKEGGATVGVMPCNTAHHWIEELSSAADIEFIHIADASIAALDAADVAGQPVGLLATPGTLKSGFYQKRLETAGYPPLEPSDGELEELLAGIQMIKAGELESGRSVLEAVALSLFGRGACRVLLACTELPIVLDHMQGTIDPTHELAKMSVQRFLAAQERAVKRLSPSGCQTA